MIKKIFNIIKEFVVSKYNGLIDYIKNFSNKNSKINKQTSQDDIHVIKAKVKKVKVKKLKTN